LSYAAKVLLAPIVRKDIFLTNGFRLPDMDLSHVTFAAYVTIYSIDIDMTTINRLLASWKAEGGDVTVKLSVGGVSQFETSGGVNYIFESVDTSAITGTKTITLEVKNTDGAAFQYLNDFKLWGLEA